MRAPAFHVTDVPTSAVVIYLGASLALLFLVAIRPRRAPDLFGIALLVNIVPFILAPHYSVNEARVGGVPLSYLPMIAAAVGLIAVNNGKIRGRDHSLVLGMFAFLGFLFFTTFILRAPTINALVYFLGWPMNFLLLLSSIRYFSRIEDLDLIYKIIVRLIWIVAFGCVVGLVRYGLRVSFDANFMPFLNRGATSILVVLVVPLLLWLWSEGYVSTAMAGGLWLLFFATLLYMFSRTGLLGMLIATVTFALGFARKRVPMITAGVAALCLVYLFGFASESLARFSTIWQTLENLRLDAFEQGVSDFRRYALLQGAFSIIAENTWFGTGAGLNNYINELSRLNPGLETHLGKSHSFYVSYLAELGLFGFVLLLSVIRGFYARIEKCSASRAMKTAFLTIAVLMFVSEYILLPELWFFFGMLAGLSSAMARREASSPVQSPALVHASV